MAILPIRKYGDPVLRDPTTPVTEIDGKLQKLIEDMTETMYAAPGVGLAANQVGVSKRFMLIDLSVGDDKNDFHVFINPEIVETHGEIIEEEGCLSIPDFVEMVARPASLRLKYLDRHGEPAEMDADDLMARAVCHEIDHLEGTLFIDYLRGLKKERVLKRIQKIVRTGGW